MRAGKFLCADLIGVGYSLTELKDGAFTPEGNMDVNGKYIAKTLKNCKANVPSAYSYTQNVVAYAYPGTVGAGQFNRLKGTLFGSIIVSLYN